MIFGKGEAFDSSKFDLTNPLCRNCQIKYFKTHPPLNEMKQSSFFGSYCNLNPIKKTTNVTGSLSSRHWSTISRLALCLHPGCNKTRSKSRGTRTFSRGTIKRPSIRRRRVGIRRTAKPTGEDPRREGHVQIDKSIDQNDAAAKSRQDLREIEPLQGGSSRKSSRIERPGSVASEKGGGRTARGESAFKHKFETSRQHNYSSLNIGLSNRTNLGSSPSRSTRRSPKERGGRISGFGRFKDQLRKRKEGGGATK